jgi:L,D-transpeptidase ErfK/SrfK
MFRGTSAAAILLSLCVLFLQCRQGTISAPQGNTAAGDSLFFMQAWNPWDTIFIEREVSIGSYFEYLDSLVRRWDSLCPYELHEHLLVRANPWLIDRLQRTDYYYLAARDSFVYDQNSLSVLYAGDTLFLPGEKLARLIEAQQKRIVLDVNIPEYRLRILDPPDTLFSFPVRVGRNERKYLAMSGRTTDLRTLPGQGEIVRISKNPAFINPVNCRPYQQTRRDDGYVTALPRIPWIEPEINGVCHGHLIHPTTNPKTLGRAYSNGCVGVSEWAMWRIYYYAPLGTQVRYRYDLRVPGPEGDTIELPDIYSWGGRPVR